MATISQVIEVYRLAEGVPDELPISFTYTEGDVYNVAEVEVHGMEGTRIFVSVEADEISDEQAIMERLLEKLRNGNK